MQQLIFVTILSTILSGFADAKTFTFKKDVDIDLLREELLSQGFPSSISLTQNGRQVSINILNSTMDPTAVVRAHQRIGSNPVERDLRIRIWELISKWEDGSITSKEKDELILKFILYSLKSYRNK